MATLSSRRSLPLAGAAAFLWLSACAPIKPKAPPPQKAALSLAPAPKAWSPGEGEEAPQGRPLRVLLKTPGRLSLEAPGGILLRGQDGRELARLDGDGRARVAAQTGGLALGDKPLGCSEARVEPLRAGEILRVSGRRYRGQLHLLAWKGRLLLLNQVGLEDYLRGVLPGEVGVSAPAQALRAQAVAARSFALWKAGQRREEPWDLDDSPDSQVYLGREPEAPSTDAAVESTRAELLTYNGSLAACYFHSNSGGHTADAAEVWGGEAAPYLRGVPDPWGEKQKHARWSLQLAQTELAGLLGRAGLWHGPLEKVQPLGLSPSSRWLQVELSGPVGRKAKLSANLFRRALGGDRLRSARFSLRRRGSQLIFEGRGWGHGVGLSQEGAAAQAAAGRGYAEILRHYYPGTELVRLQD